MVQHGRQPLQHLALLLLLHGCWASAALHKQPIGFMSLTHQDWRANSAPGALQQPTTYTAGGLHSGDQECSKDVWHLSSSMGWQLMAGAELPFAMKGHSISFVHWGEECAAAGCLLLLGGTHGCKSPPGHRSKISSYSAGAWQLPLESSAWAPVKVQAPAAMQHVSYHAAASSFDGSMLFVVGGISQEHQPLRSAYAVSYDEATRAAKWTRLPDLPSGLVAHSLVVVPGSSSSSSSSSSRLYVCGAYQHSTTGQQQEAVAQLWVLELPDGRAAAPGKGWRQLPSAGVGKAGHVSWVADGLLFVRGGMAISSDSTRTATTSVFDLDRELWLTVDKFVAADTLAARAAAAAAVQPAGLSTTRRLLQDYQPRVVAWPVQGWGLDGLWGQVTQQQQSFTAVPPAPPGEDSASTPGSSNSGSNSGTTTSSSPGTTSSGSSGNATATRQRARVRAAGGITLSVDVTFTTATESVAALQLPPQPRMFVLQLYTEGSSSPICSEQAYYLDQQTIDCVGAEAGSYTITLADTAEDALPALYSGTVTVTSTPTQQQLDLAVPLGLVQLSLSFKQLIWAGGYYLDADKPVTLATPIPISGASALVTTQNAPSLVWAEDTTGKDGVANVYLLPGASTPYQVGFTAGGWTLASGASNPIAALSTTKPTKYDIYSSQSLLCTGEWQDVRGSGGTFPSSLTSDAYYLPNTQCHWLIVPSASTVLLDIDYSSMLKGEVLIIALSTGQYVVMRDGDAGGGRQAFRVVVEDGLSVTFVTNNGTPREVGGFRLTWVTSDAAKSPLFSSQTMLIVLSVLSSAGALLAACCFYCICCTRMRRRNGGVVFADGNELAASGRANGRDRDRLRRVPTPVRELLPTKAYTQPAQDNPLPGFASGEAECCSICLLDFEQNEKVTVLPCRHFYHPECINLWLGRNTSCPLCKNDILRAIAPRLMNGRESEDDAPDVLITTAGGGSGASAADDGSAAGAAGALGRAGSPSLSPNSGRTLPTAAEEFAPAAEAIARYISDSDEVSTAGQGPATATAAAAAAAASPLQSLYSAGLLASLRRRLAFAISGLGPNPNAAAADASTGAGAASIPTASAAAAAGPSGRHAAHVHEQDEDQLMADQSPRHRLSPVLLRPQFQVYAYADQFGNTPQRGNSQDVGHFGGSPYRGASQDAGSEAADTLSPVHHGNSTSLQQHEHTRPRLEAEMVALNLPGAMAAATEELERDLAEDEQAGQHQRQRQ